MKQAGIIFAACILVTAVIASSQTAGSADIQIVAARVAETGQEEKLVEYKTDKGVWKTEIRTLYHYRIFCLLKNTGTEGISVFTDYSGVKGGSLSPGYVRGGVDGKGEILLHGPSKRTHKGDLIVPCAAKLGIVDLEPGELAQIRFEGRTHWRLSSPVIKYNVHDDWGGRFGNCVGRATSEPIEVQAKPSD